MVGGGWVRWGKAVVSGRFLVEVLVIGLRTAGVEIEI
jgi:hypothetical protein